jgi:hypothetical protein
MAGLQKEGLFTQLQSRVACNAHLQTFKRNQRTLQMRADNSARNCCKWLKSIDRDNSNLLQQRAVRVSEQRLFLDQARDHVPAPQTQISDPQFKANGMH